MRTRSLRRAKAHSAAAAALLLAGAAAASAATASAASAAPAPNGTATVNAVGMQYTGLVGPNKVTVALTGSRFLITDTAPITAGPGCAAAPAPAGLFGVFCQVPKNANGTVKLFRVSTGAGNDIVINASNASMRADGGQGNDVLNGGTASDSLNDNSGRDVLRGNAGPDNLSTNLSNDTVSVDVLEGGAGDDDLHAGPSPDVLRGGDGTDFLRGGLGADILDAGAGLRDVVTYLDNVHENVRIVASLDGVANDGIFAGEGEKDNVLPSAEILAGSHGSDTFFGNDAANHFIGNLGDDVLIGARGADLLEGGPGNDRLASNQLFGVPVQDGSIDTLNGGSGTLDYCRVPFVEADITIGCEIVDKD